MPREDQSNPTPGIKVGDMVQYVESGQIGRCLKSHPSATGMTFLVDFGKTKVWLSEYQLAYDDEGGHDVNLTIGGTPMS